MNHRSMAALVAVAGIAGIVCAGSASACDASDLRLVASPAQTEAFSRFVSGFTATRTRARSDGAPGSKDLIVTAPGSIVGLWKFAFTAPDGVSPIDWGFQTWHSDGTEITNSGGRPPRSGNFCMGVWAQHSRDAYTLNHWAIAWGLPPDFDDSAVTGLVNIRESLNLDKSGNEMTGTVSLDLYDLDGSTLLAHLVDGTVSGTRITP